MSPNDRPGPDGLSRWQKFRLVVKVVELRLRFIALMAITGLMFAYWDTLWNRYEKWMRPAGVEAHLAVSGIEYYCPMHPQVVQDEPGGCPICGMPLARRRKAESAALPEGVLSRVQLTSSRIEQAGIRTVAVAYAADDGDADDRRQRRVRRAAAGDDPLEGRGEVAGREAPRQLHRSGRAGGRAPGRALQPRAAPGDPGAAHRRPRAEARSEPGPRPMWAVPCSAIAASWSASRSRSSSGGASHGPRSTRSSPRARSDFTIPILAPIGGTVVKKNVVRGAGGARRLPDVRDRRPGPRLDPGAGLRAAVGPGPRGAGRRGDGRGVSRPHVRRHAGRSSSRRSTPRPARSRCGSTWRTPGVGSCRGCSPR